MTMRVLSLQQDVVRAVVEAAGRHGFSTHHVGDAPGVYGVQADTPKQYAGTLTTWLACRRPCPCK
jgi:hypothetical protein